MHLNVREKTQEIETQILSPRGALSQKSKGRLRYEPDDSLRTPFQRDRDRVLHCKSFRRLKHKTQVFLAPDKDHYRTRLTHTLEVSQVSRTIARALRLNEDLTEAIALGHDLGHTPFGHAGERALDEVCPFGFAHFEQSLRVVDRLEKHGEGLNLTHETRDGIKNHTKDQWPETMEGCVVRYSDRIAYINHDIEDAIIAEILTEEDLPKEYTAVLGCSKSERLTALITSLIEGSDDEVKFQPEILIAYEGLHNFLFDAVYTNPVAKSEEDKAIRMIQYLYRYFCEHPDRMSPFYVQIAQEEDVGRAACDYIAGMTDRYAVAVFEDLAVPASWKA